MPVQLQTLPTGKIVMLGTCDGCGEPAIFGHGDSRWCGWRDGECYCRRTGQLYSGSTRERPDPIAEPKQPTLF